MNMNLIVMVIKISARSFSLCHMLGKKNKAADRRLIIIMFIYSAIKIKAKVPDLYSVLNPETSSDSPSARSKGVRLVSAKVVINHVAATGHIMMTRVSEQC